MPGIVVVPDVLPVVPHESLDLQVTISDDSINFYTGTFQKREAPFETGQFHVVAIANIAFVALYKLKIEYRSTDI